MPFHFDFDSTNRILRCSYHGRITDEDLMEHYRVAGKYLTLTNPRASITDLSAAQMHISPQMVRQLASFPPVISDLRRSRFVVAPSDHAFGMARMFQLHGEDLYPNLHVVRTAEEVWTFLGVKEPVFAPIRID